VATERSCWSKSNADAIWSSLRSLGAMASQLRLQCGMLKLLGSIALARLLGFGILGFLVIYALLSLLR
jgi:hypothetical protein